MLGRYPGVHTAVPTRSPDNAKFHVVVLQMTAKKCTNILNARAQLLFCSLNSFPLPLSPFFLSPGQTARDSR